MRAGFDLGLEAFYFILKIVGDRIHRDANRKIRCATKGFSRPVGPLIQAMQNFDQADGIDFVDPAGFRIIADRRRIAGDGKNVANAADGPRAEKRSLQADDVLVACGEMRNGFDATGFETVPHLTTRDQNIIGLQAALLGAWTVGGVRNVLAITGDPPSVGDYPET